MQLHIPTIETQRLRLIAYEGRYLDEFAALYGDPAVMEHIREPIDRVEAWKVMARHAGQWVLRGYGGWLVQLKESEQIIGVCGLFNPEGNIEIEIGWIIAPSHWGKGYATEASRAALAYAFDTVGAKRIMARITPGNAGSIAVAYKLGMVFDSELSDETTSYFFTPKVD